MSAEIYERPITAKSSMLSKGAESPSFYETTTFSSQIPKSLVQSEEFFSKNFLSFNTLGKNIENLEKPILELVLKPEIKYESIEKELKELLSTFGEISSVNFFQNSLIIKVIYKDYNSLNKAKNYLKEKNVLFTQAKSNIMNEIKEEENGEKINENENEGNISNQAVMKYLTEGYNNCPKKKIKSQIFRGWKPLSESFKSLINFNINEKEKDNERDNFSKLLTQKSSCIDIDSTTTKKKNYNLSLNKSTNFINNQEQRDFMKEMISNRKYSMRQNLPTPIIKRMNNHEKEKINQKNNKSIINNYNSLNSLPMSPFAYYPYQVPIPVNPVNNNGYIKIPVPVPIPVPVVLPMGNQQNIPYPPQFSNNCLFNYSTINKKSFSNEYKKKTSSLITNFSNIRQNTSYKKESPISSFAKNQNQSKLQNNIQNIIPSKSLLEFENKKKECNKIKENISSCEKSKNLSEENLNKNENKEKNEIEGKKDENKEKENDTKSEKNLEKSSEESSLLSNNKINNEEEPLDSSSKNVCFSPIRLPGLESNGIYSTMGRQEESLRRVNECLQNNQFNKPVSIFENSPQKIIKEKEQEQENENVRQIPLSSLPPQQQYFYQMIHNPLMNPYCPFNFNNCYNFNYRTPYFNKDVIDFDKLTLDTKNTVRFKTISFREYDKKYVCNYKIQIENDDKFSVTKRIIGRNGCFLKKIIQESCIKFGDITTKIRLRGKGSGYAENGGKESEEPLMLCVSSLNPITFANCCLLIEGLLNKIYNDYFEYSIATMTQETKERKNIPQKKKIEKYQYVVDRINSNN